MPRLRMKPSTSTEEAVLIASRRAARKSKQSHKLRSESISPPRRRPPPTPRDDDDFDESSLPPHQAYKRTRTQEEEEEEFREKLRDADLQDAGIGYHEHHLAYSTSYGSAAGNAAGISSNTAHARGMDEEEYAEYIRAGMWRLQNKERLEFLEKQAKLNQAKLEKEKLEALEREKKEKLKRKKLSERKRKETREERTRARERYDVGWTKLQKLEPEQGLRFTDFVWPSFPPFALPPISWPTPNELTPGAISDFLVPDQDDEGNEVPKEARKAKLRSAVLSYHPDRFERFVQRVNSGDDGVQDRVRELGLRVSQVLNDLLKESK